jgi:hypothetical protein
MSALDFNIYSVSLLFGIWHGLLFAVLLLIRAFRKDMLSDYILAGLLLAASVFLFPYMLGFMGQHIMWNELLFFPTDTGLLIGPLIFLYILAQTDSAFRIQRKHLWHFLPFLVYVAYHLIVFAKGRRFVQSWIVGYDLLYIAPLVTLLTLLSNYIYF